MSYDANGNRLGKAGGAVSQQIAWDGENRPSQITVGALAHLFAYGELRGQVLNCIINI
jgi:hypothetical protein